eukprot:991957-Pelagomonas_calceolata.AAC.4
MPAKMGSSGSCPLARLTAATAGHVHRSTIWGVQGAGAAVQKTAPRTSKFSGKSWNPCERHRVHRLGSRLLRLASFIRVKKSRHWKVEFLCDSWAQGETSVSTLKFLHQRAGIHDQFSGPCNGSDT